jgi:RHS repeat-associated protein
MLERVTTPRQVRVSFGYDALGRRVYKEVRHTRTRWLWDGNTPLHEWTEKEPQIDLVTWVFEEGTFVPAARVTDYGSQSIITDYLGTPVQMYDAKGEKTWEAQLDIYGRVRTFAGRSLSDCPFRYQGQYEDEETGLYYNRFRYYDPNIGSYISQAPIGLAGGNILYGYVHDSNKLVDRLGLNIVDATLTLRDGSVHNWTDIGADKGAKDIFERTGDTEQKLLRDIETKFSPEQLKGSTLDITSKKTWVYIPKLKKAIPTDGIKPCDFCDKKMSSFAKDNNMNIK